MRRNRARLASDWAPCASNYLMWGQLGSHAIPCHSSPDNRTTNVLFTNLSWSAIDSIVYRIISSHWHTLSPSVSGLPLLPLPHRAPAASCLCCWSSYHRCSTLFCLCLLSRTSLVPSAVDIDCLFISMLPSAVQWQMFLRGTGHLGTWLQAKNYGSVARTIASWRLTRIANWRKDDIWLTSITAFISILLMIDSTLMILRRSGVIDLTSRCVQLGANSLKILVPWNTRHSRQNSSKRHFSRAYMKVHDIIFGLALCKLH